MGCRNPWRISVDSASGNLYWGDVGPDAGGDGDRGPRSYDEINQARRAGNFGWPYFIGNNFPYADVDFATGKVGPKFDPLAPGERVAEQHRDQDASSRPARGSSTTPTATRRSSPSSAKEAAPRAPARSITTPRDWRRPRSSHPPMTRPCSSTSGPATGSRWSTSTTPSR